MVVEGDAHALFATEHLTGHECVEDSRTGQGEAEIEAKQPPIFGFPVKLKIEQEKCEKKNSFLNILNRKM